MCVWGGGYAITLPIKIPIFPWGFTIFILTIAIPPTKSHLLDLEVSGNTKILMILLGVTAKKLKSGVLPPPRSGEGRLRQDGPPPPMRRGKTRNFQNVWGNPLQNQQNFDGTPNLQVKKCEFLIVKEASCGYPNP